ncbi:1,4-dihydroxy-2-naphthoate polyprenyltransferase [Shewanella sp. SR44-3]|nr:1,4-dihydroxy-2-naphthoate polyprenyltransferase [Shewanella sp. SR44-3]
MLAPQIISLDNGFMTQDIADISQARAWLLAIRPRTLPAAIGPLLVGNVLALGVEGFSLLTALITLGCGLLLQISVNLGNDYFDSVSGVDTHERLGPLRLTQAGIIAPKQMRNAMIASLISAFLVGFYLIVIGGWPIGLLAAASILAALSYSGGPYPLASHGLGELTVFIFFGLVAVVGSFYLQTGITSQEAWLLGAAIGSLNAAIMLVNNTRDMSTDAKANKRTLAVRLGQSQARVLYQTLVYLPYAIIICAFLLGFLPGIAVILCGLSLLYARKLSLHFHELSGAELNPILAKTALLTFVFSVLFSLGWYLGLS